MSVSSTPPFSLLPPMRQTLWIPSIEYSSRLPTRLSRVASQNYPLDVYLGVSCTNLSKPAFPSRTLQEPKPRGKSSLSYFFPHRQNQDSNKLQSYVGGFSHDYEMVSGADMQDQSMYQATGCGNSMMANRISWFYDLRGPSFVVDTACSSSMVALHEACRELYSGSSKMVSG